MRQGGMFSFLGKRTSPLTSPKRKGRGAFPLDPAHWQFVARRAARAAQCRCGVHGFAMNPCESLPLSTAPYYREARVTVVGRQTAYRMRHCCARRIDKTGGRRRLLRTSTRWAERQRIVGAETSRIAKSLAASVSDAATQAVDSASVAALRAAGLQWRGQGAGPLAFSWGSKEDILSRERISPFFRTPHGTGYPFTL